MFSMSTDELSDMEKEVDDFCNDTDDEFRSNTDEELSNDTDDEEQNFFL